MESKAYIIVDWIRNYEVTAKGHATDPEADPPDRGELRRGPLPYVRIKRRMPNVGPGARRMRRAAASAGLDRDTIEGFFLDLLQLAAGHDANLRGWVLDDRHRVLDDAALADVLDLTVEQVQARMAVLTDLNVHWVELALLPSFAPASAGPVDERWASPETPGEPKQVWKLPAIPDVPGVAGNSRPPSRTETETEEKGNSIQPKPKSNGESSGSDSGFSNAPTSVSDSDSERPLDPDGETIDPPAVDDVDEPPAACGIGNGPPLPAGRLATREASAGQPKPGEPCQAAKRAIAALQFVTVANRILDGQVQDDGKVLLPVDRDATQRAGDQVDFKTIAKALLDSGAGSRGRLAEALNLLARKCHECQAAAAEVRKSGTPLKGRNNPVAMWKADMKKRGWLPAPAAPPVEAAT